MVPRRISSETSPHRLNSKNMQNPPWLSEENYKSPILWAIARWALPVTVYVVCKPHEHWFFISTINPTLNQVMFTNLATLTIVTFTRRPALTKWTKPTYIAKWGSVVQFASYLWVPVAQSHGSFPCSSKARQEFAHGVVKVHKTFLLGTEWGYASLIYCLDEWGSISVLPSGNLT